MSIQTQIDRLQDAKSSLKAAISEKGVTVPDSASLDDYASYVSQIINADTVDGWHFAVRDDGTPPTSAVSNTLTFVYNKNGG